MNTNNSALTLALTVALGAATGVANIARAADNNPFAIQALSQGYMVAAADSKVNEGKFGGDKAKTAEGKCGASKAVEGKCGGDKAGPGKMTMMEFWINQDEAGGFSFAELSKGIPVMMMMKDGKMVLVPVWSNPDQAGGFSLEALSKGLPVMMKGVMKDGKMMLVPIWANADQAGGFSLDDLSNHRFSN